MSPSPSGAGKPTTNTVRIPIELVRFLLGLAAGATLTTLLSKIIWIPFYGDALGFCSLMIEATLGLPQLLSNHRTKSVKGLSLFMIFSWFAGDFFKTVYFVMEVRL